MSVGVSERSVEELVALARRGDRAAFGSLYDALAPDVQRFLVGLRLDVDRHRIEDAVQETFLRLHGLLARYDAKRPLKPFVLGVARRVALELERRARPSPPVELDARAGKAAEAPHEAIRAEREGIVAAALLALEAEERSLVVLRFVNELTMQDLADSIGCSVPTARTRLLGATSRFGAELVRRGLSGETA